MEEIQLETSDGIAVLTLSAPERRNALTLEMAEALINACDEIDSDRTVGAVVVRGAGRFFCAGAHREFLAEAARDPAAETTYSDMSVLYDSFVRVGSLEPPTVAAVRGGAVGAGVNLAFSTDIRIVGNDAILDAGFLRVGIHPGGGHFSLVSRAAGREAAGAMGLFGQSLTGKRAAEIGAAWDAVSDEKVETVALEIAAAASADPELSRAAVRSFRIEVGPPMIPWPVALQAERAPQMWSLRRKR